MYKKFVKKTLVNFKITFSVFYNQVIFDKQYYFQPVGYNFFKIK
jgi:hypothetical protein